MSTFDSEGTKLEIETWKILDQLRARLQALVGGLTVMQSEIGNPNGRLPPWPQFQTSMNRVQREMNEVVQYLKEQQEAVSSIVVVPDPKFPLQQQHILDTLMRTKMEPATEEWIDQNLKAAREKEKEDSQFSAGFGGQNNRLSEEDREKFWLSAVLTANLEGRKHVWGADFTMAEKELGCENIDTGLLRELDVPPTPDPYTNEDLSGEEEDEDQYQEGDMDVEGGKYPDAGSRMDIDQTKRGGAAENSGVINSIPSMPIDAIHKFMTKGELT